MAKWVYSFGDGKAEGRAEMRNLLGGKGANLAEMSSLGLPVPPGFTITTEVCTWYYANGNAYPGELKDEVEKALAAVEKTVGAGFGDANNPLLVSVRSGARASMPGMMDTVLNLGLNDRTVLGLGQSSGDERFAWDSYRRFIQMYSNVVLDVGHHYFEEALELKKEDLGVQMDTDLKSDDWRSIVGSYKKIVEKRTGKPFPQEPREQLWGAIGAVFSSWMNQRAITYRRLHDIPESWGTAVNVQAMVFGNMGEDCATGVAFTRDPSTGANLFYGEYLVNAQGEDVVAGIRTPQHLTVQGKEAQKSDAPAMEEAMPTVFKQLDGVRRQLEKHYRDMQDIEFTVQRGKLYMLQTRNGKRTAKAALKIAVDMVREGLIDKKEAVARIVPASLDQLLHPTLDPKAERKVIAKGLPASPGAASGKVVFTADEAEKQARAGEKVILVRRETSPEDIHGMHAAEGILTSTGGMTSHAAVVARGMGKPCVAGAGDVRIDGKAGTLSVRGTVMKAGDFITLDGSTGEIMLGVVPTVQPELSGDFAELMAWADEFRTLGIRTNAETPLDAGQARKFGAEGIGLCRTEHMFFEGDRIVAVRQMILADDEKSRRAGTRQDPAHAAPGLRRPVRDHGRPARHHPPARSAAARVPAQDPCRHGGGRQGSRRRRGRDRGARPQAARVQSDARPSRLRLGISYPEIYEMQARAIFEAVVEVQKKAGKTVIPEIMIPLVATRKELDLMKAVVDQVASEVSQLSGQKLDYLVGTMIELPRAALRAGEIAQSADFFSFGTNDLTQTTFGLSRDDSASFLEKYQQHGILEHDPFASLDIEGVGELIEIACERGRKVRNDLKLGICGEHGGDPASVFFCHKAGLDYVSCSPYRVPIARLAAAQAALGGPLKTE